MLNQVINPTSPLVRRRQWLPDGVRIVPDAPQMQGEVLDDPLLDGYLTQLEDDGLAKEICGDYFLKWDDIYAALANQEDYATLREALQLPADTTAQPSLQSSGALADNDFSIVMTWSTAIGDSIHPKLIGPIFDVDDRTSMMSQSQWELFKAVGMFAHRKTEERNPDFHRQMWGRVRKLALTAKAKLDSFLRSTVVLTPERLQIELQRSSNVNDHIVEIQPLVEGVSTEDWLRKFDKLSKVQKRYDISGENGGGITQVVITPKVKTVLDQIKRLPGRRMAGSRAQAFLLNPYAALGDDAHVIEETQFEQARERAGLVYERFTPVFERNEVDYPIRIGLRIEKITSAETASSQTEWLDDAKLDELIQTIEKSMRLHYQLVAWAGYDLVIDGDTERHLADLKKALARRQSPETLVTHAQIYDLSHYAPSIEGIGIQKPYYSPYIAKKDEGASWFPDNVLPVITYIPEEGDKPIAVPITRDALENLKSSLQEAQATGKTEVRAPGLPKPISVIEAEQIVKTFAQVFQDLDSGKPFDPAKPQSSPTSATSGAKTELILRANIQSVNYEERRLAALQEQPAAPELPHSIKPGCQLLPHQREGLAWMQHLYRLRAQYQVRGAVLADDMGLGKTFQLLALMAWIIEKSPDTPPMLVVAPVSLLENWSEEVDKFFVPGALPLLTAYGSHLASLRVPRAQIDQKLQQDNLVKFLRPGWVGSAKIVLTTYETLRDFEFSFANQKWALMVCDEAQRIKNPAAMITRAAKKQNAAFKIACTGTPVENTLADLWCLFDYVQPGLLGALNDFGARYRKPIEAKTEEQKKRVEELREIIKPQILRRIKSDVAKDLPKKIEDKDCRDLHLSVFQRNAYAQAIRNFKIRDNALATSPFKSHLSLLHYLRRICTDPQPGLSGPESVASYCKKAPKLDWLLKKLQKIKQKNEKVIVFCEFRDVQRLLQHYIEEALGFRPDIINGETVASAQNLASRQKRIRDFQNRDGFGVIILSPLAVGFGVNIQAANHVVHYMRTWNPAKEDQASDRAYRIGQKKDVYVYYPTVRASDFVTFDAKLDDLLTHKRELAHDMLNGSGDITSSEFDITDIVPESDRKDVDDRVTLDIALRMNGHYFECLATILWKNQGFDKCYRTPATKDNGVDIVALRDAGGQLVQVKSSSNTEDKLPWNAVKDVVAGEAFYQKRHPGVNFEKVCITNQFFNAQAHENARLNNVTLLEQPALAQLLVKYKVTILEVEQMHYAAATNS